MAVMSNETATAAPLIHIFRAGTHTTMDGEKITFTVDDLAASAAAYDPTLHETPLVVGHPQLDAPAYGWIQGMKLSGADLFAVAHQVDPAFAGLVNAGRYKKRSVKWYRPDDAANPKPGVWYPRHIGFLGAQPPAVKGLKNVQFADENGGVEFAEWPQTDAAPSFAEKPTQEEPTVTEEEKAALTAENAALKKQLADAKAQARAAESARRRHDAAQFCETLIGEGKVLPAEKDTVVGLLMLADESHPVQFGEGDGAVTEAPKARLETFLQSLPKRVAFGETAKPAPAARPAVQFAAAPGMPVDTEALDIHAKALAYQRVNKVDYITAVKAVQAL